MIVRPAPMVRERFAEALKRFGLVESVTEKLGVTVPAALGVPEIAPEELIVRPAGRPVAVQL